MIVNVISNLGPLASVGLERDYLILKSFLESLGHTVRAIDVYSPPVSESAAQADLNLWLESLHDPRYLQGYAKTNWYIPNSEWHYPEWDRYLPLMSLIICKTKHAHEIWSHAVGGGRCLFTGFMSRDMLVPGIAKQRAFFHVAGKSSAKGTSTVLKAWQQFSIPHALTVVTCSRTAAELESIRPLVSLSHNTLHARHLHNASDEIMTIEYNRARFYIGPSLYEGYSHTLNEALSAKAVVLTTDARPMCELDGMPDRDSGLLIPVSRIEPRMKVSFSYVNEEAVAAAVERAVRMSEQEWDYWGDRARRGWQDGQNRFVSVFGKAIRSWYSYI